MISKNIESKLNSGLIRKMFEEGNRLKALYGKENVYDFSIGNPDLEPPAEVISALKDLTSSPAAGMHGYMSNNGYLSTRSAVAEQLSDHCLLQISPDAVCMTVGAAGAMNAVLRSVLDPGEEVILLAPFFMEYVNYIDNHSGKAVIVPTEKDTFFPDLEAISASITPKTKALIINSPNNPSGVLYPVPVLKAINELLKAQDHVIHVISDEPYRDLVYDGLAYPSAFDYIDNLIVCFSWSKSLSLPGERIGYTAVSPRHADCELLCKAIVFSNRILGSVNAPALFQRVIEKAINAKVDVANYEKRRDMLYDIVTRAGFSCNKPNGALYLFVKSPDDDMVFCEKCAKHNLLVVPGSAFQCPGYFRLAFCVSEDSIIRSEKAFVAVGREYGLIS